MKKIITRILAAAAVAAAAVVPMVLSAPAAGACGNTVIAVGGFGGGNAAQFAGKADVLVQYSGALNDIEGGIGALTAAVNQTRANCPGGSITLTGHSQGAAIVHIYLSRNGLPNGNAVLFADPKQLGTGQSDGLFAIAGAPIAGTDANFRGVPTVSICNGDDAICNRAAGWIGYLFTGAHTRYDYNARAYAGMTGVIWR